MPKVEQYECDAVGCKVVRTETNHWLVVFSDQTGVHIYPWDKAPKRAMKDGQRFCGITHTMLYVSKALTPDTPQNPDRESTLELKPPLNREGKEN